MAKKEKIYRQRKKEELLKNRAAKRIENHSAGKSRREKLGHVTSLDEVFSDSARRQSSTDEKMSYLKASITFTMQSQHTAVENLIQLLKNIDPTLGHEYTEPQHTIEFDTERYDDVIDLLRQRSDDVTLIKSLPSVSGNHIPIPRCLADLDECGKHVLMYGTELDADHPGFKDEIYRKRRKIFTEIALNYKHGDEIPKIDYTEEETNTWGKVYKELKSLYPHHACESFVANLPLLETHCGYSENQIPQLEDVSKFLQWKSGFRLRPVAGFLSPRDFLAGLAFRVFNCTQYIRHSSDPFYTPEPDVCHELLGHVPLLADPEFAKFNQEIGLASLGASDEDISKLAACYLYTVEFGLCKEKGQVRAYGAGLLSSIAELKHALTTTEKLQKFDPARASVQEFYVTTYQPVYFVSESIEEASSKMRKFVQELRRPLAVTFDPKTCTISTDPTLETSSHSHREILCS